MYPLFVKFEDDTVATVANQSVSQVKNKKERERERDREEQRKRN